MDFPTHVPAYTYPIDVTGADTPIETTEVLPALERHLQRLHVEFGAPLADEEIRRLEAQLPCRLPPLLRAMYRWHNGSDHLFAHYTWLPLADVVSEYQFIKQTDRETGLEPELVWPEHLLPVFRFDSKEHVAVDCRTGQGPAPMRLMQVGGAGEPRYRGLGHLLAVTLAALESGGYENTNGDWHEDPIKLQAAYRRYALPTELKIMDDNWTVLDRQLRTAKGPALDMTIRLATPVADARLIPLLRPLLRHDSPITVVHTLQQLRTLRAETAKMDINALLDHPHPQIRAAAIGTLSELDIAGSPPIIAQLLARLGDDEEMVRFSAIEALGNARTKQAVEPLVKLLASSRPGIQRAITNALGQIGDRSALPSLQSLQAKLATMDLSAPSRGGTRSADPPPAALKAAVDAAIQQLGG